MLFLILDLKMAHEQQRKSLEEEFQKIRLSLQVFACFLYILLFCGKLLKLTWTLLTVMQDQVDTLTFQNRSLRDRAKRFEEALRKSTDEQIVVQAAGKHTEGSILY